MLRRDHFHIKYIYIFVILCIGLMGACPHTSYGHMSLIFEIMKNETKVNRMKKSNIHEKIFSKVDFTVNPVAGVEYENCTFESCNFSTANLSDCDFTECLFKSCNLGMAKIAKTAFKNVSFKDCKLLGLHFENCNPFLFEVNFENCILNLSSFYKLKLKKITFKNSGLNEVDFTEADLSYALFDNCDLAKATFDNTILERADFRTSYNYSIDPEINRISKAKFSTQGIVGLLDKYDIEIE